ncbi:hypothetical protein ACF0H5_006560 [Mactra antiquata]
MGICLKVNKNLTGGTDLFIMFVYSPPSGSPFYLNKDEQCIDSLEQEILHFQRITNNSPSMIMGDLNARVEENNISIDDDSECMSEIMTNPVSYDRNSQDKTTNT